jgi:mRNA interferase RelE/StbE
MAARYTVEFAPRAAKAFAALPVATQRRLAPVIERLSTTPRPNGVRKLQGADDLYRVRSGDYRVIYQIQDKRLLIAVVKIGHRRDVYGDHP